MNEKLLTYLPYILPVQEQKIDDDVIEITAKHFKAQYGELILNLLHNIDLLPCEAEWIQKKNIDDIIAKICEYSSLSMKYCHGWNINLDVDGKVKAEVSLGLDDEGKLNNNTNNNNSTTI